MADSKSVSVSISELCVVCETIRGLLESGAAPCLVLPVRLRASCAFSHTPLRHGVDLVIIAIMEWKRKPPFKSWSNSVVNFPPICSALSQVTIHGLKIYWMCAMRLLAVFSPFIPLPHLLFLCQSALWHWVLSVYLFSSIIKNTAADGRQQPWLDGWQCAHSNIHTHTDSMIFSLYARWQKQLQFLRHFVLCQAKPSQV